MVKSRKEKKNKRSMYECVKKPEMLLQSEMGRRQRIGYIYIS